MTMASAIMSSASYLAYLNEYIDSVMNFSDRVLLEHLDKSFMDEIQEYTRMILAQWHSEQEIDAQSLTYIRRVGLLNRKIALLMSFSRLTQSQYERIQKLLCHPNSLLLFNTIIQLIGKTSARHKDEFLRQFSVLIDALSLIKHNSTDLHQTCTQVLNSKYYKHYLKESISSTLGPAHIFFVGAIGQLASPTDNRSLIELLTRFLITFYDDTHLPSDLNLQYCTRGILLQLQGSALIDNYPCISALVSLFIHASSKTATGSVRIFIAPILNLLNSLCTQSKTAACYLNSDRLIDILLQYVTDQNHRSHIGACLLLAHTISEQQLNTLRIAYKLTMKCIDLLLYYSNDKHATNDVLNSLLSLAVHEQVQSVLAETYQLSRFIQLAKYYPVAYELIWMLSFHPDIVQQLTTRHMDFVKQLTLSSTSFVSNGILQNTQMNTSSRTPKTYGSSFDVCLTSSPSDQFIVQQINENLTKAGLRVGTTLDSHCVLLCASEETKYDCTCQATVRQAIHECKKVMVCVVRKPCRLDDWLGILVAQVRKPLDSVEGEVEHILTELRTDTDSLPAIIEKRRKPDRAATQHTRGPGAAFTLPPPPPPPPPPKPAVSAKKIKTWTNRDVLQWCEQQKLGEFSKILTHYDGRSLLTLAHLARVSTPHSIISQLRNDCRKQGLQLSFVEFVRFQTALDELVHGEQAITRKQSMAAMATRYVYKTKSSS